MDEIPPENETDNQLNDEEEGEEEEEEESILSRIVDISIFVGALLVMGGLVLFGFHKYHPRFNRCRSKK